MYIYTYTYIHNTHGYISVRRVCKHDLVSNECELIDAAGRNKRQLAALIEATSFAGAPVHVA